MTAAQGRHSWTSLLITTTTRWPSGGVSVALEPAGVRRDFILGERSAVNGVRAGEAEVLPAKPDLAAGD